MKGNHPADSVDSIEKVEEEAVQQEAFHSRSIAFPPDDIAQDEKPAPRLRGPEMRRELTIEDKELSQAVYEHLGEQKNQADHSAKDKAKNTDDLDKVDIYEHKLPFADLANELKTSFNGKDAGKSAGLSQAEADARIQRDGPNVLTPPKKKSALRKVVHYHYIRSFTLIFCLYRFLSTWSDYLPCSTSCSWWLVSLNTPYLESIFTLVPTLAR